MHPVVRLGACFLYRHKLSKRGTLVCVSLFMKHNVKMKSLVFESE